MNKLRFLLPTLLCALTGIAASARADAQIGVYLNPSFAHIHIGTPDYGPYSFLGDGTTSRWFGGVAFGGYDDFFHRPGYSLGVDIRDTILHGNNAGLNTFSVGARIAGTPSLYGFRPYAQVNVGAGRSKPELSTRTATKAEYDILGGLDYTLGKHLDLRAIEIGYGSVPTVSSTTVAGPTCQYSGVNGQVTSVCTTIPSVSLLHVSAGLVVRFGKVKF